MDLQGKRFLVLGAGISGRSAAATLAGQGARVTLSDRKQLPELEECFAKLRSQSIELVIGKQEYDLLQGQQAIVVSPGVPFDLPLLQEARARKIPVMSEVELAYRLCVAPIIGITGTNGKTTTTTLIGEMLAQGGKTTMVGGNIGEALTSEVGSLDSRSMLVAELSSFQLEGVLDFRPKVAVILNLTPDHIDRHHTLEAYRSAKENIFRNQTADDSLVLNFDDPAVRDMGQRTLSKVWYFSTEVVPARGACLKEGKLVLIEEDTELVVCNVDEVKLMGRHNLENALAACCAAHVAGITPEIMGDVLRSFTGVEHRIEWVRTIDEVPYYNDSKATNPESAIKALEAFPGRIILLAGGRDKMTDLTPFMTLVKEKVDELILLGEAAERFAKAAKSCGVTHIRQVRTLREGVEAAYTLARPPQIVLLSPACASYDMFANYEQRGTAFKQAVALLDQEENGK